MPLNTTVDTGSPAVVSYRELNTERMYCFVRGADSHLHVMYWDGVQWHWADQGVPPNSSVSELGIGAITYSEAGIRKIYCFTIGFNDSSLYVNYWDGTVWRWASQGAPPNTSVAGKPSVITYYQAGSQRIYVFLIGRDGHLHVNYWDGTVWRWADLGTPPNTNAVRHCNAVARTDGSVQKIEVFMWASNDHLYDCAWDGIAWKWIDLGSSPGGPSEQPSAIAHVNDWGAQSMWVFLTAANGLGGCLFRWIPMAVGRPGYSAQSNSFEPSRCCPVSGGRLDPGSRIRSLRHQRAALPLLLGRRPLALGRSANR